MTNALDTMRAFVRSFPGADILGELSIDYTDNVPGMGGLFPSGLVELRRRKDITGVTEVDNQYNFALYTVLAKSPGDDAGATYNASWLMDFQEWVQAQSVAGHAPQYGDVPGREQIIAQHGVLYSAEDEGIAIYTIQLSAMFTKVF